MAQSHGWRRKTAGLLGLAACLTLTQAVCAHPMGNFSINHYVGVRADGDQVLIRYRLDLAEIPTAQQMPLLDLNQDGKVSEAESAAYLARQVPSLTSGLRVRIDGSAASLVVARADLQVRPGAADLPTLLITVEYHAAVPGGKPAAGNRFIIDVNDENFPDSTGWREITARDSASAKIVESSVPRVERSNQLQTYPADPTEAPPQEREARIVFEITRSSVAGVAEEKSTGKGPAGTNSSTPQDRFTRLIAVKELSAGVLLGSLLVAFVLGSFHALSPGHGKTVVAAYLVGARGTARHAVLLGLVVTLTHVVGVLLLGLTVLFASTYVLPERLYPWLGFFSGLMIVLLGVWQFSRRFAYSYVDSRGLSAPVPSHAHGPGGHTHDVPDRITPASLIALGVSGGIVPCPSALVVMLSAIALHRTGLGLVLIVVFSAGLASVLIAIGVLMLYARQLMMRLQWSPGLLRRAPMASSLLVALLGGIIAAQAVIAGGILPVRGP